MFIYSLVSRNLVGFSFEDKRMALNALNVKVTARPDKVEIRGTVPADYVTIERTSGCLLNWAYDCTRYSNTFRQDYRAAKLIIPV